MVRSGQGTASFLRLRAGLRQGTRCSGMGSGCPGPECLPPTYAPETGNAVSSAHASPAREILQLGARCPLLRRGEHHQRLVGGCGRLPQAWKEHSSKPPHLCHTHLYLLRGACPWAPTPRGRIGRQWHMLCPVATYPEWTSSQLPALAGDTAPGAAQPPAAWVGPKGFQFHVGFLFSFWFYFCTPGPRRTRRVLLSVPRWTEHKHSLSVSHTVFF